MESIDRNSTNAKAYEGGSFRDRPIGKGLFYAIPPNALRRLGQRYEYGHLKYGNTEAFKDGLPISTCIDSIYRHLLAYIEGDNTEDHMAALAWNAFAVMLYEEKLPQWQDLKVRQDITQFDYLKEVKV